MLKDNSILKTAIITGLSLGTLYLTYRAVRHSFTIRRINSYRTIEYPIIDTVDAEDCYHGVKIKDPYRWLEDINSDQTKAFIQLQNQMTNNYFSTFKERDVIKSQFQNYLNYEKISLPFHSNGVLYYQKKRENDERYILYRQNINSMICTELINPMLITSTSTISMYDISYDGQFIIYLISEGGSDRATVYIKNLTTLCDLDEHIDNVIYSNLTWTKDNKGFFYSKFDVNSKDDKQSQNHKLFYHYLFSNPSHDLLIYYDESNPNQFYSSQLSDNGCFLFIYSSASCDPKNGVYLLRTIDFNGGVFKLIDNNIASWTFIACYNNIFFFLTNYQEKCFRVISIPLYIDQLDFSSIKTVVCVSPNILVSATSIDYESKHYLVIKTMENISNYLYIYDTNGTKLHSITLPTFGSVDLSYNDGDSFMYYSFTSFLHPNTLYYYDFHTNKSQIWNQTNIPSYNPDLFTTEQIFYDSDDQTKIPMFIIKKKSNNDISPTILYGYGGFNISLTPYYESFALFFVTHFNGVYAIANIRGGGEYGLSWHDSGILYKKQNSFTDFYYASQYLVHNKYTSTDKLTIFGGSNGGLLVTTCSNQNPEQYGCVIAQVPVTDILRYHKSTIGYMWRSDYGTSEDSIDMFRYIYSYSPLHNILPNIVYPPTLILTSDTDDRVVPFHSYKYAALLQFYARHNKNNHDKPLLLRVDTQAGHLSGLSTLQIINQYTDILSFISMNTNSRYYGS